MERREVAEALQAGLGHLTERDRRMVWLFHAVGVPQKDIAADVGVSPNSPSTLIRIAVSRLRDHVPASLAPGGRRPDDVPELIRELYSRGDSVANLVRRFGLDKGTVQRCLNPAWKANRKAVTR